MTKKILIGIISYLLPMLVFHLLFYRFKFNLENISNSIFYIGIFSFVFGLISVTNAQNVFIGFRYYISQLFKKNSFDEKITYSDYKDSKLTRSFTYRSVVMLTVGATFIVLSLILAEIAIR